MPRITRSKLLYLALAACLLLGAFGTWVLLHPASMWVQPWRAARSDSSERIIFGPYPVEADFTFLKSKGVTTIVSLLNPDLPYERVLLAQEREHAARHGMKVLNFPMGSILGHSFGKDYMANSRAAAEAALNADGAAYIHCYLGLHRAKNVQRYLAGFAESESYAPARHPARQLTFGPATTPAGRFPVAKRFVCHDDSVRAGRFACGCVALNEEGA